jgi:hypothetical protein
MTESANPSNSDKLERADFHTVKETAWHLRRRGTANTSFARKMNVTVKCDQYGDLYCDIRNICRRIDSLSKY